jgi:hypothetical protein
MCWNSLWRSGRRICYCGDAASILSDGTDNSRTIFHDEFDKRVIFIEVTETPVKTQLVQFIPTIFAKVAMILRGCEIMRTCKGFLTGIADDAPRAGRGFTSGVQVFDIVSRTFTGR